MLLLFISRRKGANGRDYRCLGCGLLVANSASIISVMGREPRQAYLNPLGINCEIVTLSEASPLVLARDSSLENTWFDGYAWRPASCGRCQLFLGWRFEASLSQDPQEFFGLLPERLR